METKAIVNIHINRKPINPYCEAIQAPNLIFAGKYKIKNFIFLILQVRDFLKLFVPHVSIVLHSKI